MTSQSGVDERALAAARRALEAGGKVAVLTGAGISAESGVPTFRGADGIWKKMEVTKLATPEAFEGDPALVWEFYNWRRELLSHCKPNPAHYALAQLEAGGGGELSLITQNVDGLHGLAGSQNILEIHGNMWVSRCTVCGRQQEDRRSHVPYPPLCPECSGLLRPGVVWFGEALDPARLEGAARAAGSCRLMLVIGTSALVYPAASLAPLARRSGATIIEINLEPSPASELVDHSLLGPAGVILPRLVEGLC